MGLKKQLAHSFLRDNFQSDMQHWYIYIYILQIKKPIFEKERTLA